jgi:hypothetical protein
MLRTRYGILMSSAELHQVLSKQKRVKKHTLRVSNDHLLRPAVKAGAGAMATPCAGGDGGAVADTGAGAGAARDRGDGTHTRYFNPESGDWPRSEEEEAIP